MKKEQMTEGNFYKLFSYEKLIAHPEIKDEMQDYKDFIKEMCQRPVMYHHNESYTAFAEKNEVYIICYDFVEKELSQKDYPELYL
jgi:hypothetical protein